MEQWGSLQMTPKRGGVGSQQAGGPGCYLEKQGQTEEIDWTWIKTNAKACKPCIWAVTIKDRASRSRRVIFHSNLAPVRPHLESCVKTGQLQHKKGVQRRPAKIIRGLDRTYEERLGELVYLIRGYREVGPRIWGSLNTRTGCPRMLWNLHPWRCLRLDGTWVWNPRR